MKSHSQKSILYHRHAKPGAFNKPALETDSPAEFNSEDLTPHFFITIKNLLQDTLVKYFHSIRTVVLNFSTALLDDTYAFVQRYKQTVFTASAGDYENRKLGILSQLNLLQLLIGLLIPISIVFSRQSVAFLSAIIFMFPPLINLLVLYLISKQKHTVAMIAYFALYPFFTNLSYIDSANLGTELFFILYSILSVFFLQERMHIICCIGFNMINYLMLVVMLNKTPAAGADNHFFFFLLNHLLAIIIIFYSLYLLKKENAGYQSAILEKGDELQCINEEVRKQKEEIAAKANQLEKQTIQLNEIDAFKNRLFSIVSHDLRGPLHALRNLFQEVEKQKLSAREVKELVPEVLKDLNYATELTDNLLNWAKSQMTGAMVTPQVIKVSPMITEIVKLIRLQAELKEIKIDCELKDDLSIYADSDMIRLVIRNLLSNAIKFTPSGGTVSVFTDATAENVEIIVKDTGEGMDGTTLEKIRSNSYYTTQGTAGEMGTGLGLMLCSDFLRKNKGLLHIESTKGKGSIFSFILPAA
ncbi:MAG: HAMP domain-containing histidine kinase [Bacteroidetes bacterium]|nr:MAG: HAMP domain-containing histidine kinase [Bacteroidota bacterium]